VIGGGSGGKTGAAFGADTGGIVIDGGGGGGIASGGPEGEVIAAESLCLPGPETRPAAGETPADAAGAAFADPGPEVLAGTGRGAGEVARLGSTAALDKHAAQSRPAPS
jgi:hypothetical protein